MLNQFMTWKIYYDDGSTFSNEDGSPYEAPGLGVQIVAVENEKVGRVIYSMNDFYWYDTKNDCWYGGEKFGLFDYLSSTGMKKVVFGRYILNSEFEKIYKVAIDDPYLPPKSAFLRNEKVK